MSAVTLQQLLDADPGPWHAMASTWRGLADRLDDTAEQFIRGTRDLPFGWSAGDGARTAEITAARLRAEISDSCNPARRIFHALDRHAHAVGELRQSAEELVAAARRAGLIVDVADGAGVPGTVAPGAAAGIVADLGAVVERARALDEWTATAIRAELPPAGAGFGQSVPAGPSRAVVEAQRVRPPADVRNWWESLTPQQQEQAIQEMPELVGWLDGLPASDRDVADRLQLGRLRAALVAQNAMVEAEIARVREELRGHPYGPAVSPELSELFGRLDVIRAQSGDLDRIGDLATDGMLLGIDPAGDGRVIVAIGDPDTARHTAVWVPGVGADLGNVDVDGVAAARRLAEDRTGEPGSAAAIMWLGYDAPDRNASPAGHEYSAGGGAALARFTEGLAGRGTTISGYGHGPATTWPWTG